MINNEEYSNLVIALTKKIFIVIVFFLISSRGVSQVFEYVRLEPIQTNIQYSTYDPNYSITALNDSVQIICFSNSSLNRKVLIDRSGYIDLVYASYKKNRIIHLKVDSDVLYKGFDISSNCLFSFKNNGLVLYYGANLFFYRISEINDSFSFYKKIPIKYENNIPYGVSIIGFKGKKLLVQMKGDNSLFFVDTLKKKVSKSNFIYENNYLSKYTLNKNIVMKNNWLVFSQPITNLTFFTNLENNKKFCLNIDSLTYIDTCKNYEFNAFFTKYRRQTKIISSYFINDSVFCNRYFISNGINKPFYANYYYNLKEKPTYMYNQIDYYWREPDRLKKPCNNDIPTFGNNYIINNNILSVVSGKNI